MKVPFSLTTRISWASLISEITRETTQMGSDICMMHILEMFWKLNVILSKWKENCVKLLASPLPIVSIYLLLWAIKGSTLPTCFVGLRASACLVTNLTQNSSLDDMMQTWILSLDSGNFQTLWCQVTKTCEMILREEKALMDLKKWLRRPDYRS